MSVYVLVHRAPDDTGWVVTDELTQVVLALKKDNILLYDVHFVIDEEKRQQTLHTNTHIVHAWARGQWVQDDTYDWTRALNLSYSIKTGFACGAVPITGCTYLYFGRLRTMLALGASTS